MGLIRKSVTVVGRKGRRRMLALFDTGASHSLIRQNLAKSIANPEELAEPKTFEAAVGTFVARHGVFVDILLQRRRFFTSLVVAADLTEDLVIGADFLQQFHIRLYPRRHEVVIDPKALRLCAIGSRARDCGVELPASRA